MALDLSQPFAPRPRDACFCGSGKPFKNCCGRNAPNRKPPHGVVLLKGWLPAAECDRFVAHAEARQPRRIGTSGGFGPADERTNLQRDPGRVTTTVDMGPLTAELNGWLARALREVAEPHFGLVIDYFTSVQVLRYEPGGWYNQHADSYNRDPLTNTWHKVFDRDVSLLLYLNDGFTGGDIRFMHFNYAHHPRKGDLLLFPSDHRYLHQADPVASGIRYAVVTWGTATGGDRILPAPPPNAVFMNTADGRA
jgi:predicted 2-oxoglutarate/Fe(II)-dependent dioxygenase YbiX